MKPTRLIKETMRPDVVIDVSNVCRDRGVAPVGAEASWGRLDTMAAVLERFLGRQPRGYAVADRSLRPRLSESDQRALDAAVREGLVRQASDADPELLEVSSRTGCYVVSNDQFRAHRRVHPSIQGDRVRFLGWSTEGGLRLYHRDMGLVGESTGSRFAELDELKRLGIDARRPEIRVLLGRTWRCVNANCRASAFVRGLPSLPDIHDGTAVCPACGKALDDLGERLAARVVVLSASGSDVRLRLTSDDPLEVNSRFLASIAGDPALVSLVGDAEVLLRLASDRSVTAKVMAGPVEVTGSRNLPDGEVESGITLRMGHGIRLLLGDGVAVRLSGQRWPLE